MTAEQMKAARMDARQTAILGDQERWGRMKASTVVLAAKFIEAVKSAVPGVVATVRVFHDQAGADPTYFYLGWQSVRGREVFMHVTESTDVTPQEWAESVAQLFAQESEEDFLAWSKSLPRAF